LKGYPPLLGKTGDPEQPILDQCPYIGELMHDLLPGRVGKCLLAALQSGAIVYPHMDNANDYFIHSYRVHVPVFTSRFTHVFCNGRFFHMAEGEAWLLNNLAPHAVINEHPDMDRVHLIFDVFPEHEAVEMADMLSEAEGKEDMVLYQRLLAAGKPIRDQNM
ncbi:MAG: aspartyl/asparaginyl beta-hydroxylase domain-containing protein, partial [Candidatus Saccharimonadales bacterium]